MIAIAMSKEELPHAILKFISWIPEPIRQDVLASVFPYAARARIENGDDAIEKMREFLLKQHSKLDTASALLSTIAAFAYVLKRHITNIRNLENTSTDAHRPWRRKTNRLRFHPSQPISSWFSNTGIT
jgi:hypothetical protein